MSDFELQVWALCDQIPRGEITTYGSLASALGNPKASRAVGTALSRNPLSPDVPCHRVLPQTLRIGGYHGSTDNPRKLELLLSEGVTFQDNRCTQTPWKGFKQLDPLEVETMRNRVWTKKTP